MAIKAIAVKIKGCLADAPAACFGQKKDTKKTVNTVCMNVSIRIRVRVTFITAKVFRPKE